MPAIFFADIMAIVSLRWWPSSLWVPCTVMLLYAWIIAITQRRWIEREQQQQYTRQATNTSSNNNNSNDEGFATDNKKPSADHDDVLVRSER